MHGYSCNILKKSQPRVAVNSKTRKPLGCRTIYGVLIVCQRCEFGGPLHHRVAVASFSWKRTIVIHLKWRTSYSIPIGYYGFRHGRQRDEPTIIHSCGGGGGYSKVHVSLPCKSRKDLDSSMLGILIFLQRNLMVSETWSTWWFG